MEFKVGDRILCKQWRGRVWKPGKVYIVESIASDGMPISTCEILCKQAGFLLSCFPEKFELLPPNDPMKDAAEEYEEIMRIQDQWDC